jgi:SOS-response transcriptional repressor LexA
MKYKIENGYPPTLNELGEILNKSVGAVRHGLRILERKGYIEVEGNRSRAIKVIK